MFGPGRPNITSNFLQRRITHGSRPHKRNTWRSSVKFAMHAASQKGKGKLMRMVIQGDQI